MGIREKRKEVFLLIEGDWDRAFLGGGEEEVKATGAQVTNQK